LSCAQIGPHDFRPEPRIAEVAGRIGAPPSAMQIASRPMLGSAKSTSNADSKVCAIIILSCGSYMHYICT